MRRAEFMKELEYLLKDISASEREDALAYYENYFDEAGEENEGQVIRELGSPKAVAEKILDECSREEASKAEESQGEPPQEATQQEEPKKAEETPQQKATVVNEPAKKKMSVGAKIAIALLIILTFPLWVGIVGGLFGLIVGAIFAAIGIVITLVVGVVALAIVGIALIILGIMRVVLSPAIGLICIGLGALFAAFGILLIVFCAWCLIKWIPAVIKKIYHWITGLVHSKKGGAKV